MSSLTLGQKTLELPLLQGGMGIGVSRCRLAGAVAHEGAMGVISAAQIGYDQDDFRLHPESANLRELPRQIKRAKALAFGRGMIGVNIMAVTQLYSQYVKTACEAGADAIITGAGLPLSLSQDAMGFDVLLAPIVSSVKALQVILKYWDKKYHRTADFLVVEAPWPGGTWGSPLRRWHTWKRMISAGKSGEWWRRNAFLRRNTNAPSRCLWQAAFSQKRTSRTP